MDNTHKNEYLPDPELDEDILDALCSCTQFDPPNDFVLSAIEMFDTTLKKRYLYAWLAGILGVIATPTLWLIVLNLKESAKLVAVFAQMVLVGFEFLINMWNHLPAMSTAIMLTLWVLLFGCAASLIKVFKVTLADKKMCSEYVQARTGGQI